MQKPTQCDLIFWNRCSCRRIIRTSNAFLSRIITCIQFACIRLSHKTVFVYQFCPKTKPVSVHATNSFHLSSFLHVNNNSWRQHDCRMHSIPISPIGCIPAAPSSIAPTQSGERTSRAAESYRRSIRLGKQFSNKIQKRLPCASHVFFYGAIETAALEMGHRRIRGQLIIPSQFQSNKFIRTRGIS